MHCIEMIFGQLISGMYITAKLSTDFLTPIYADLTVKQANSNNVKIHKDNVQQENQQKTFVYRISISNLSSTWNNKHLSL